MSNRLPILSASIGELHGAIGAHQAAAAEKALAAGAALVEAKSLCRHGEWQAFLAETGAPERSAQRYMKLHRANLDPATVADLGLNLAEKYAGHVLKLWPGPGGARHIPGGARHIVGYDESRFFWALTLRDGERAFYANIHGLRDEARGAQSTVYFKPLPPEFLAKLHEDDVGGIPFRETHDLTPEQAEIILGDWNVKVVRHAWGARLEPRAAA